MDSEKRQHSCCFFGHRKIDETPKLIDNLTQTVEGLIVKYGVFPSARVRNLQGQKVRIWNVAKQKGYEAETKVSHMLQTAHW